MRQTSLNRKDSVVISSIGIISELGIKGLTSKEISKREKISEGTLFSHFKSMDDIVLDVLKYHSELDTSIIETVELKKSSPLDAIRLFASIYAENYENYPESTCLINISEMLLQHGEVATEAEEIMDSRIAYLKSLIEKAQIAKDINPEVDSQVLTDMVIGSFLAIVHRWRKCKYTFRFKAQVINTFETFLNAFSRH